MTPIRLSLSCYTELRGALITATSGIESPMKVVPCTTCIEAALKNPKDPEVGGEYILISEDIMFWTDGYMCYHDSFEILPWKPS